MKNISKVLVGLMMLGVVAPVMAIELAPTVITAKADPVHQGVEGRHGGHEKHGHGGRFKELNLTDEQKQQLKEINERHRKMAKEEFSKILTPEQIAKLEKLKSKRHSEMKGQELEHVGDGLTK